MMDVPVRWLSAKNAATYLEITVATLYSWASDGTIPAVRITRRHPNGNGLGRHRLTLRFDRLAIDAFMERRSR
jgi:excisionase family DNA binding protein